MSEVGYISKYIYFLGGGLSEVFLTEFDMFCEFVQEIDQNLEVLNSIDQNFERMKQILVMHCTVNVLLLFVPIRNFCIKLNFVKFNWIL